MDIQTGAKIAIKNVEKHVFCCVSHSQFTIAMQPFLCIPNGFAHGFQTLTDNCQLLYIHSEFYKPDAEGALNAFDSKIDIAWPLDVTEMSDRDRNSTLLD